MSRGRRSTASNSTLVQTLVGLSTADSLSALQLLAAVVQQRRIRRCAWRGGEINLHRLQQYARRMRRLPGARRGKPDEETLDWVIWASRTVGLLTGGECLEVSALAWCLLARRFDEPELIIGTRWREGQLDAHAWLEYDGEMVHESSAELEAYRRLPPVLARG